MPRKVRTRCGARRRPLVEGLERKQLLATIIVNTAANYGNPVAGTISLSDAIEISNGQMPISSYSAAQARQIVGGLTVPNLIEFDIPGPGPFLLSAGDVLQPIEKPVIIDGYSQPGAHPNTNGFGLPDNAAIQIELDGMGVTGLDLETGGCTIQGLSIGDSYEAISLSVEPTGGVQPTPPVDDLIQGDFIGVDATGNLPFSNTNVGIIVVDGAAPGTTIGGTTPAARNVISGNGTGIDVLEPTLIQGNYIGTDAAGTSAIPNGVGINLSSGAENTIGGTAAGAGNVISGNSGDGIEVQSSLNLIEGNLIGTDAAGTAALGNGGDGVAIPSVALPTIDATPPTTIVPPVNLASNPGSLNTIGGTAAGAGNVIADNHGDGVSVRVTFDHYETITGFGPFETLTDYGYLQAPQSGQSDAISGNSIFGNARLGIQLYTAANSIDLSNAKVNPPLPGTPPGANDLLPAPAIASAVSLGFSTAIAGTVGAGPYEILTVELFGDPPGEGQGQVYLGSVAVATDATGHGTFAFRSSTPLSTGFVTATAADPSGNTSQFSADAPAVVIPSSSVALLGPNRVVTQGVPITFTAAVASTVPGTPTGSVEFLEDGVPLGSSSLAADGLVTFVTDQLLPGPHVITAEYLGDGSHPASAGSNAVAVEVTNVTAFGGPAVTSDVLSGSNSVTVTFNRGLFIGPAQDVTNYKIMGPRHQSITIESAVYNPSNASVTLTTAQALDPHKTYQLTINGQKGDRVVDVFGIALNGKKKGKPGHNYSGKIAIKKTPVVKVTHSSASKPKAPKPKVHAKSHK